jgi:hypothetical protein
MATKRLIVLLLPLFLFKALWGQQQIIEIDPLTSAASKVMPYNQAFTIKVPINAEDVNLIHIIKKYKYYDLEETIKHYIDKGTHKQFAPTELPGQYYYTRKIEDKNFLFVSFCDDYMLEPSSAYYIILGTSKLDAFVVGFFDTYYQYSLDSLAHPLAEVTGKLQEYEDKMHKVFGPLVFRYFTVDHFRDSLVQFAADFTAEFTAHYKVYNTAVSSYNTFIINSSIAMAASPPNFDSLIYHSLHVDSSIRKEALDYITGKEVINNDFASDLNTITLSARLASVLNGSISLGCIFCEGVNIRSTKLNDITKRLTNIASTTAYLNRLKRALYLLNPVPAAGSNVSTSITQILAWINFLQASRSDLQTQLKIRKGIEGKILSTHYTHSKATFAYSSVVSGNSFLNFETRNKILLTPDFGVVTPAITSKGKGLQYGIVPYLGFHVSLMAVDRDLSFNSYRKNWKQYFSLMVGWSLVDMKQDTLYDNFFEKSALLTGIGYRLNNVIRITAGTQWLFRVNLDADAKKARSLRAIPFVGLSFDLNIRKYLNGFVDVLSGIGKTKVKVQTSPATISSQ